MRTLGGTSWRGHETISVADRVGETPGGGGRDALRRQQLEDMRRQQEAMTRLVQRQYAESRAATRVDLPTGPEPTPVASANVPTGVGPVPLEGYDANKLHNLDHQTPKYIFGRVASHFPLDSVTDHASAEALLREMAPVLTASGLEVLGVDRDKILVNTGERTEWIDVVRGAGSGNPGWWWGPTGQTASGPVPDGPTGGTPQPPSGGSLQPLTTVPPLAEYEAMDIDASSVEAAIMSAARWVRTHHPELFSQGDNREAAYQAMTRVIGGLRAAGFDAHRVVNHSDRPVGDPYRYGSDALVLEGTIYDVYGAFGEAGTPQALNQGAYGARPRE